MTTILRDRFTIDLVAGTLVVLGVLALNWPVLLDDYDRWGFRIACGTGWSSSDDQATLADQQPPPPPQPQSGYTNDCHAAVLRRRAWATSVIGVGGGIMAVLLSRQRRSVDADGADAE